MAMFIGEKFPMFRPLMIDSCWYPSIHQNLAGENMWKPTEPQYIHKMPLARGFSLPFLLVKIRQKSILFEGGLNL